MVLFVAALLGLGRLGVSAALLCLAAGGFHLAVRLGQFGRMNHPRAGRKMR